MIPSRHNEEEKKKTRTPFDVKCSRNVPPNERRSRIFTVSREPDGKLTSLDLWKRGGLRRERKERSQFLQELPQGQSDLGSHDYTSSFEERGSTCTSYPLFI